MVSDNEMNMLYRRARVELHERSLLAHEEVDAEQAQHLYEYSFAYLTYLMVGGEVPIGHISFDEEDRYHCRRMIDALMTIPDIHCPVCDQDMEEELQNN